MFGRKKVYLDDVIDMIRHFAVVFKRFYILGIIDASTFADYSDILFHIIEKLESMRNEKKNKNESDCY